MHQPLKNEAQIVPIVGTGRAAFSLVELAVVLAIIGVITGGIMATSGYLKTSKMSAVVMDGKYYMNAFKQFEVKYSGALPGDLSDPTSYWAGSGAFAGDGNGSIGVGPEFWYTFKHLQLAGLTNGNLTGLTGPAGPFNSVIGLNLPELSMEGVGGYFATVGDVSAGDPSYFAGAYNTPFFIGKKKNAGLPSKGFLTPREALELDQKYDDGQASTGWIRNYVGPTTCTTATQYDINSATPSEACILILVPE